MPASKTPLPPAEPLDTHDALLRREEAGGRRRLRRRWLIVALVLTLLTGAAMLARQTEIIAAFDASR